MNDTNTDNELSGSDWSRTAGSLANSASFNLIYLVFLFFPWMFVTPRTVDVMVAAALLAVFVPVHFRAFYAATRERVWAIGVVAVLGVVANFFVLGAGVFHIYCGAMAGFCRPVRVSGVIMAACVLIYGIGSVVAERTLSEQLFVVFMSLVVWFGTLSTAQSMLDKAQQEREQELDRQTASLMERERIGRDLHDLLGHTLTMVALKSDLANRLMDSRPDQAKQQITEIQDAARQALEDVRRALSGLASVSVESELKNAQAALTTAGVALNISGTPHRLSNEQDQAYGLMIREAVTNIIRHTSASEATIRFEAVSEGVQLTITDNGGGSIDNEGRGLHGLRKRIESLGGSVNIRDDAGVSLQATLPVLTA